MTWAERLSELYELFAGLGVAILVLGIVAWLFGMQGETNAHSGEAKKSGGQANPNLNALKMACPVLHPFL